MYTKYEERKYFNQKRLIKRRKEIKRQKIAVMLVAIVLSMVLSVSCFAKLTFAKSNSEYNLNLRKYYTSVIIYRNDTIDSIADKYCAKDWNSRTNFIDEVLKINHLDNNTELIPGNYLVIPYYR